LQIPTIHPKRKTLLGPSHALGGLPLTPHRGGMFDPRPILEGFMVK